jgi:hypothetical protein
VNKEGIAISPNVRLPLHLAYLDPAFQKCLGNAISEPGLLKNFDRLNATSLSTLHLKSPIDRLIDEATGHQEESLRKFLKFVYTTIYLALPDEVVDDLRGCMQDQSRN